MAQRQAWSAGTSQQQQRQAWSAGTSQQHQNQQQQQQQHQQGELQGAGYAGSYRTPWNNSWQQGLPIAPAFSGYQSLPQVMSGYGGAGQQYSMPGYYNNQLGILPDPGIAPSSQGYQPQAFPPAFPYYGRPPGQYPPWQPVWNGQIRPPVNSEQTGRNHNGSFQDNNNNKRGWKRSRESNSTDGNRQQRPRQNNRNVGGDQPTRSRCETCDRSFGNRSQMHAHLKTHVKCSDPSCSFEAIGSVVNEHMLQVHCTKVAVNKVLTKEHIEENERWREERRKNYPTSENMRKKLQKLREHHVLDEDAVKRQESLKEILAKQKELGCAVAEVPTYYFSRRYTECKVPRAREQREGSHEEGEIPTAANKRRGKKVCQYFQQGRCRKGQRCTFLHVAGDKKRNGRPGEATSDQQQQQQEQPQNLLAKLLQRDMEKENSQLLQCFRFLVNNNFLQDETAPLKHFDWTEEQPQQQQQQQNSALAGITMDVTDDDEDDGDEDEGDEDFQDYSSDRGDREQEQEQEEEQI